jgi:GNAT superfamily N-acetyltransferase
MSRRGNCWDNAVAASFFSSLKKERVKKRIYRNREKTCPLNPGKSNCRPLAIAYSLGSMLRPMLDVIAIRRARPSEREALEALQKRASLANPGDRDAILAYPDAIEIPMQQLESGHVYVAERNNAIVGFAAILSREDGDTELDALFVEPSLWRRGIGQQLVKHCEDAARLLGSRALHVIGNPHAREFYISNGFKSIGVSATRFGEGILYRRALD